MAELGREVWAPVL